jgi:hypothetical protein
VHLKFLSTVLFKSTFLMAGSRGKTSGVRKGTPGWLASVCGLLYHYGQALNSTLNYEKHSEAPSKAF